jgi:tetratricopeptide (TPR) repeat protein
LRDYENSLSDFAAVIALTPDNHWRLFTYSLTFRAYGNLEEASKKISIAIQIARVQYEKNLADNRTALTLALYYLSNDDSKEAEFLYESVLSKNVQLELVKEAIQALDDFLEIFPYHSFSKSIRERLVRIIKI